MFKKLSNLLFEEEDEIEEEYNEEPVVEVKKQPKQKVVEEKPVAQPPVFEKKESAMNRIDVTQPVQTNTNVVEAPAFKPQPPVFNTQATEVVEPVKKPSLGITVDEVSSATIQPTVKKTQPVQKPKQTRTAKPVKKSTVYEFSPIISPIFGVDDKDMNALSNSAKTYSSPAEEGRTSKILSPIYGAGSDEAPVQQSPVANVETVSRENVRRVNEPSERIVPEFSLDDILNTRDSEDEKQDTGKINSIFSNEEDIDTTVVIDSRKYGSSKKGE